MSMDEFFTPPLPTAAAATKEELPRRHYLCLLLAAFLCQNLLANACLLLLTKFPGNGGTMLFLVASFMLPPLGMLGGAMLANLLLKPHASTQELLARKPKKPFRTLWQRMLHAVLWGTGMFLILQLGVGCLCGLLCRAIGLKVPVHAGIELLQKQGATPALVAVLAISSCLLAPVAEELFYRRLLPKAMEAFGFPKATIWIAAAFAFAFAHKLPWAVPVYFFFALAQLRNAEKNDLPQCMLIHAFYNAITLATAMIL